MNWKKIKEDCPKCWDKLIVFMINRKLVFPMLINEPKIESEIDNIRSLFDFFDHNDLWIEISINKVGDWDWIILIPSPDETVCMMLMNTNKHLIRLEAEKDAFTSAFKLLEKKLK